MKKKRCDQANLGNYELGHIYIYVTIQREKKEEGKAAASLEEPFPNTANEKHAVASNNSSFESVKRR